MKKLTFLAHVCASLLFTFSLIEVGLRLLPGLVPLPLLIYFDDGLRSEIAYRRNLPTQWGTETVERDDGGPELRVFKPFSKVAWPIQEDVTVVMDQLGFCNPTTTHYQAATIDLITLGDSFTTCHAVNPEETWTNQLGLLTNLSTYNLGRGGTGIQEYIQFLKKYGLAKSPQAVIMNIYEGNDLRDAGVYYYYHQNNQPSANQPTPATSETFYYDFLDHYSYGYNLGQACLKFSLYASNAPAQSDKNPFTVSLEDGTINFKYNLVFPNKNISFNPKNTDTDEVVVAKYLHNQEVEAGVFTAIEDSLKIYIKLSKEHHFIPIVTYTPSSYIAYQANVVFEDAALTDLMTEFSNQQRAYFQEKGRDLGYTFIDLTPALQAAAQASGSENLLYYRKDLHLTPAGHLVIAQTLSQLLPQSLSKRMELK